MEGGHPGLRVRCPHVRVRGWERYRDKIGRYQPFTIHHVTRHETPEHFTQSGVSQPETTNCSEVLDFTLSFFVRRLF